MPVCVCVCARACVRTHYLFSVLLKGFPDSSVGKKKKKSVCNPGDHPYPAISIPFILLLTASLTGVLSGRAGFTGSAPTPGSLLRHSSLEGHFLFLYRVASPEGLGGTRLVAELLRRIQHIFTHMAGALLGTTESLSLAGTVSSDTDTRPLQHGQNCPKFHF